MQIEYNEAVTFNTYRTMAKRGISKELLKEMIDGILGLLFNNINFTLVGSGTALDIIEGWLPCSCLVKYNKETGLLTIANVILGCKFFYAVDFTKNVIHSLADASVNSGMEINDLKQEYDNYDASKEEFAGEDII